MSKTEDIKKSLVAQIKGDAGVTPNQATIREFWNGLSRTIIERIAENWEIRPRPIKMSVSNIISAEFLVGRSMLNNLINLDMYDEAKEVLASFGQDINEVLDVEYDAGLGNGGLGRLAACFLDSCATMNLPVTGYGILYRYGLFRQEFENGFQKEYPDAWMEDGYPLMVRHDADQVLVRYNDMDVIAVPYDLPITGYHTDNVNTLRLWCAVPLRTDFVSLTANALTMGQGAISG